MCMNVCLYVCTLCIYLVPLKARKCVGTPRPRVTDVYELPCGCWEPNPGPLQDQPVLLTAEPSPDLKNENFKDFATNPL